MRKIFNNTSEFSDEELGDDGFVPVVDAVPRWEWQADGAGGWTPLAPAESAAVERAANLAHQRGERFAAFELESGAYRLDLVEHVARCGSATRKMRRALAGVILEQPEAASPGAVRTRVESLVRHGHAVSITEARLYAASLEGVDADTYAGCYTCVPVECCGFRGCAMAHVAACGGGLCLPSCCLGLPVGCVFLGCCGHAVRSEGNTWELVDCPGTPCRRPRKVIVPVDHEQRVLAVYANGHCGLGSWHEDPQCYCVRG